MPSDAGGDSEPPAAESDPTIAEAPPEDTGRAAAEIGGAKLSTAGLAALLDANRVTREEAAQLAVQVAREQKFKSTIIHENLEQPAALEHATSLYAINFENGGFVVVAGDKRQEPVLAYADTGYFDLDALQRQEGPEGLRSFFARSQAVIHALRVGELAPVSSAHAFASRLNGGLVNPQTQETGLTPLIKLPDPGTCNDSYDVTYEINFPMKWNQGCGWNAQAPLDSAAHDSCGRDWAGCVAVATGMVMKYYQHPSGFSWSFMPNDAATPTTAGLLRTLGAALNMDYGASGSSADTADVEGVLENYGYASSVTYTDYLFEKVRNEIAAKRPVIMAGWPDCDFLGFPTCSGHAWVVTGVRDTFRCESQTYPQWFKMNWGWSGDYNGWYLSYQLQPGSDNFNYMKHLVIGIKPKT
jgi:hypothetical protein